MGGSYYDRPVISVPSSSTSSTTIRSKKKKAAPAASQASKAALSVSKSIHKDCDVRSKTIVSSTKTPIIICFDITGSMSEWPRVVYDKLPMFIGQCISQGYIEDPEVCFMAVGGLKDTLQVTSFAKAMDLDNEIKKLWMPGSGRGKREDYECAAYFITHRANFSASANKPFLFVIGDAQEFSSIQPRFISQVFGDIARTQVQSESLWNTVKQYCNVFHFHKENKASSKNEKNAMEQWSHLVGADHVLQLSNAKACVDAMLGVLSITMGQRTVTTYLEDMEDRGQDDDRLKEVKSVLMNSMTGIQQAAKNLAKSCEFNVNAWTSNDNPNRVPDTGKQAENQKEADFDPDDLA